MFDFIRLLITDPIYAVISVLVLWQFFALVLIRLSTLSPKSWVRFEFFWVGLGFVGVLSVIEQNRLMFEQGELERVEIWVENDYKSVISLSGSSTNCWKYNNTGVLETDEFKRRQKRLDEICHWASSVNILFDSLAKSDYSRVPQLPVLNIKNPNTEFVYDQILREVKTINDNISRRDELRDSLKQTDVQNFANSFGVLLLIIAFALRLTVISYKARKERGN